MAENDVLLTFGVDKKSLEESIKTIASSLKAGIEDYLAKKPITFPAIDVSKFKFKGKINLSDLSVQGFIQVPVDKIRITGGALDLSKIPTKGSIKVDVQGNEAKLGGVTNPSTVGNPLAGGLAGPAVPPSVLALNKQINATENFTELNNVLAQTQARLESIKSTLVTEGLSSEEASAATAALTRNLTSLFNGVEKVDTNLKAGNSTIDAYSKKINGLTVDVDKLGQKLDVFSVEAAKQSAILARGNVQAGPPVPQDVRNLNQGQLVARDIASATAAFNNFGATLNQTKDKIEGIKSTLISEGATTKEAEKSVQSLTSAHRSLSSSFERIDSNIKAGKGGIQDYHERINVLNTDSGKLIKNLDAFSVETAKNDIAVKRSTSFMESFGFKVGILGFGFGILGGTLQRLTQNIYQFVTASAAAVEPLERVQNLITQLVDAGDIPADQKNNIFAEINRLADLPGANIDSVTESFRKLLAVTEDVQKSLALVEGIGKATGRSGTGSRGQSQLIFQLAQFAESQQLSERDIKTIREQGGADIAKIISTLGGKEGITKLGPSKFFDELIARLKEVPAPLEAAQDKLNKINNSLIRIRLNILDILKPGLDQLLKTLNNVGDVVQKLKNQFDTLSPSVKDFIGKGAIGVAGFTAALAGLFAVLAAVGIGLATAKHSLDLFGVSTGNLAPKVGNLVKEYNSFGKIGEVVSGFFRTSTKEADNTYEAFVRLSKGAEQVATKTPKAAGGILDTIKGFNPFKGTTSIADEAFNSIRLGTKVSGPVGDAFIGNFASELGAGGEALQVLKAGFAPVIALVNNLKGAFLGVDAAVAGVGSGLLKILGFTNPIGIAINFIVALITNAGGIVDKIVDGFSDITKEVKKLFATFTTFGNSPIGKWVVGLIDFLSDVFSALASEVGTILQTVLGTIADIIQLINDVFVALSQGNFLDGIDKLTSAILNYFIHMFARISQLALGTLEAIIRFAGPTLEKLGLFDTGASEEAIKQLQEYQTAIKDVNVEVHRGVISIAASTDATNDNTAALKISEDQKKKDAQFTEEQKKAYDELAKSINKVTDETRKLNFERDKAALDKSFENLQKQIDDSVDAFKKQLPNLFEEGDIDNAFSSLTSKISGLAGQAGSVSGKNFALQFQKELNEIFISPERLKIANLLAPSGRTTPEGDKALSLFQGVFVEGEQNPKNFLKLANEAIANLKSLTGVDSGVIFDAIQLIENAIAHYNQISESFGENREKFESAKAKAISDAKDAADKRKEQRYEDQLDAQARATITGINAKIEENNAKIEAFKADVEAHRLTETASRKERLKLELENAQAESDITLIKLSNELTIAQKKNDLATAGLVQEKIDNEHKRLDNEKKTLTATFNKESEKDVDSISEKRLKRLEQAAKLASDALDPLAAKVDKLIGLFLTDGSTENFKKGLEAISIEAQRLSVNIPSITQLLDALQNGNLPETIKALTNLQTAPAKAQQETQLKQLKDSLQSILLSGLEFDDKGKSLKTGATVRILSALGLDSYSIQYTKDQIKTAIEGLDVNSIIKVSLGDLESLPKLVDDPAIEEFLGLLDKVKALDAQIGSVEKGFSDALLKRIDDAVRAVRSDRLTSVIINAERDISTQELTLERETNAAKAVEEAKALRQTKIRLNLSRFELADINLQFDYRELIRQAATNEEKKRLEDELAAKRIKLAKDTQAELDKIAGKGAATPNPTNIPTTGLPTTKTPGGIDWKEIQKILNDPGISKTQRTTKALLDIKAGLDSVHQSGAEARDAIMGLFDAIASGQYVLDDFADLILGSGSYLQTFQDLAQTAFADIGKALADALVDVIVNGGNFLQSFGKFLGDMLIQLGTGLIELGTAAVVIGGLAKIPFFAFLDPTGLSIPQGLIAIALGTGIVAAGALLGGGNKKTASASDKNASNGANSKSGAAGDNFDPNKDPRTIYQKALQAQISIDIRTDDTQIVKTIIKHVNGNGRLSTLIGNRKLSFGY